MSHEEQVNDLFKQIQGHPLENVINGFLFEARSSLNAISGYAACLNMIDDHTRQQIIFGDLSIHEACEQIIKNVEQLQIWAEALRRHQHHEDLADSHATPSDDKNDK